MTKRYPGRTAGLVTCALSGLVILAQPGLAPAQTPVQEIFQEQADALREELHCRPPTEWPDLPRRPRPESIEASVDSIGVVSYFGGGVVTSTTIRLPQYANFYNPTTKACEPAIVLEADEVGNFVYTRPFVKTAGVAPVVFFDLLGDDPPKWSDLDAGSGPDPDPGSDPDPDSG